MVHVVLHVHQLLQHVQHPLHVHRLVLVLHAHRISLNAHRPKYALQVNQFDVLMLPVLHLHHYVLLHPLTILHSRLHALMVHGRPMPVCVVLQQHVQLLPHTSAMMRHVVLLLVIVP
jgi:hypothetical protein